MTSPKDKNDDKDEKPIKTLSEEEVKIMQTYGAGPYATRVKTLEADIKALSKRVNELTGIKESDTGLAHPSHWDLVSDKQVLQEEQPLQVSAEERRGTSGGGRTDGAGEETEVNAGGSFEGWDRRAPPRSPR